MPASSRNDVGLNIVAGPDPDRGLTIKEEPFRIAFISDFGRAERGPLSSRRPVEVDPGDFESVLEDFGVTIETPVGSIAVRELDDLHPDRIYERLPVFRSFREMRERL